MYILLKLLNEHICKLNVWNQHTQLIDFWLKTY